MKSKKIFELPRNSSFIIDLKEKSYNKLMSETDDTETIENIKSDDLEEIMKQFFDLFTLNIVNMIANIPPINNHQNHSNIAILFSGGVDCSLLAYFILKNLEKTKDTLDLINICFLDGKSSDRKNSIASYKKLKILFPNRKLNLVCINKDLKNVKKYEKEILLLMNPLDSLLDFNISLIFKITTQGKGFLYDEKEQESDFIKIDYESPAKVYFSGLGADEIFGGYSRHRVALIR